MNNIIIEALQVMLFGMLGIFLVMGVILLVVSLLKYLGTRSPKSDDTGPKTE